MPGTVTWLAVVVNRLVRTREPSLRDWLTPLTGMDVPSEKNRSIS